MLIGALSHGGVILLLCDGQTNHGSLGLFIGLGGHEANASVQSWRVHNFSGELLANNHTEGAEK